MSSSRLLSVVLCLLCMALLALAENPKDNKGQLESRSRSDSQQMELEVKDVGGKTLEQWKKDLSDPDPSVRAAALMALPYFRNAASKVIPDVCGILQRDRDASPRVKAAMVLKMIPVLPVDRTRVIRALGSAIGHDGQSIIRYEAAATLKYFCPLQGNDERSVISDLLLSINSPSTFELRDACIDTLIYTGVDPKTGPDPRVTKALIARADHQWEPTTRVRVRAIMALGAMGRPQHPNDLTAVLNILKSPANFSNRRHPSLRIWSHVAVIALDEKADKKELETIAGYLKDREAANRVEAVTALGALEDKAQSYVTNICDMLQREKETTVKAAAARSLGRLKNTGPRVIGQLTGMMEDQTKENVPVLLNACISLGELGVNSAEVMKALNKTLQSPVLEKYQKDFYVQKAIDDITHPKKKVVKKPAKEPEKSVRPNR